MPVSRLRFTMYVVAIFALIVSLPRGAAEDSPRKRLAAIEATQRQAKARFGEELQAAGRSTEARERAGDRYLAEVKRNVAEALRLAREAAEDPAAADALKFVIKTNGSGPGPGTAEALRMMLDHRQFSYKGQGDVLAHIALRLFLYPEAERYLRRVLDENPNHNDRGAACYWLADYYGVQAGAARRFRANPEHKKYFEKLSAGMPIAEFVKTTDPDTLDLRRKALLERAVKEFGDVALEGETRRLGDTIPGQLFSLQHLQVGQAVTEIVGPDADGKSFKLSETRGKVVVLTFSGSWCGPCVEMYPDERKLVARHKDRPFALVSVMTDKELATLKGAIAKGDITWRCWWDGGTDGPITTRWGVTSFPTIFVLDRQGVIRFKDVRGNDLDRAVAALLDAPEPAATPR